MKIELLEAVAQIDPAAWDACANPEGGRPRDPFTTHRFLLALERSRSVGQGTGWLPRPLVLRDGGKILAVAPLYVKGHSQGEYIFDHAWADAYEKAGGEYYPKLQLAVPFTPATGRRFLLHPDAPAGTESLMLQALAEIAKGNGLSSVHVTFCTPEEAAAAPKGWLNRIGIQFHWDNQGYGSYDAFLAALSSRKRKALRKERAVAQAFGGEIVALTGDQITPAHWDSFWEFYQDTGARKWGQPYLTRAFFDEAQAHLREDILLVLAVREGVPVAGALNFIGRDTLYGRYWGQIEDHPCLHFELCYHQAIDHAIAHGLTRVEAGAQGEHKLARGYLPREVHSLHYLPDAGFHRAVAAYLEGEKAAIFDEIAALTLESPFKDAG